ncbi:MAG: uroporphyrinogen-III C-methyltransferase [Terriglobales bacterium]
MSGGKVYLVGAGPGDPELLTRKGARVLEMADAVLCDALVNEELLALAPAQAERCYVGKRAGCHAVEQEAIGRWMVERARRGMRVVRLQGGDPMVFGRGAEEMAALEEAGVAWEVIPGVSAATGVAAAAGIALTERGVASGVRIVTGHRAWEGNPTQGSETVVVLMAAAQLKARTQELQAQGWDGATPAAVIARGTLADERRVWGRLDTIAARAQEAGVGAPAVLIVGGVARRRPAGETRTAAREVLPGVIVLGHGSPHAAWQHGVMELARAIALPGQFTTAAFLDPVRPNLADAAAAARRQGVHTLVVVPYFLAAGVHVQRDLPALIEAEQLRDAELRISVSACLEGHPGVRTAVLARAEEARRTLAASLA